MSQMTFSIIKPDAVASGHAGAMFARIQKEGFTIKAMKMVHLSRHTAEGFYAEHKERPFFNGLIDFMTEGAVILFVVEADDAVVKLRALLGATNPEQADEGTLRKEFAENIERNGIHGSDSPKSAERELAYFFSKTELVG